jgi:hypothetical protein
MARAMERILVSISRIAASVTLADDGGGDGAPPKVVVIQSENNSLIERVWRDVQNGTRALLIGAGLPREMRCYAAAHHTMLRNLIPQETGRMNGKSPFDAMFRHKSGPDMARVTEKILVSISRIAASVTLADDGGGDGAPPKVVVIQSEKVIAYTPSPDVQENIELVTLDGGASLIDVEWNEVRLWVNNEVLLAASEKVEATTTVTCPTSMEQARKAVDGPQWMVAINKEMKSLVDKGTFQFMQEHEIPADFKYINMSTKLTIKWKKDGQLERRKARCVANGSLQSYGVDYECTFAPSSQLVSVKMILVIAVCLDLTVYHLDVVTASLNATLTDDIYVRLPAGLDSPPSRFAKLKKSVYGLKKAARDWYNCQVEMMMKVPGMQKSNVELCWYYIRQKGLVVHILVHVDDYIIATNSPVWKKWFVDCFSEHSEITDLGILDQVVGIGVSWGDKQVALTRTREILVTAEKYGLGD